MYKSWAVLFYQERIQSNILTGADASGMSARAIGDLYRRGFDQYRTIGIADSKAAPPPPSDAQKRIGQSARYLADHMGDVPVLLIPLVRARTEGRGSIEQASAFGSILPATWSFMLAARARGLRHVSGVVVDTQDRVPIRAAAIGRDDV